ncbi:hypothetical protein HCJ57_00105 [Listeria booriae]|uniref:hypothetical protein n=1 Tax=Listeria booriae TaxID=1552123 RepID=UPI00162905E4|nr:hypothetical protein [Listeria booriae]MBC2054909.1 hypothetical protein [Listeria booriae]
MTKKLLITFSLCLIFLLGACSTAPNGLNDNKSASPDKQADELATSLIQDIFAKKELPLKGTSLPKYKSSYQDIIDGKDYLYGAYYQKDKIHYLFTFIDKETPEKLELTLEKIDNNWQLTALNPWKTKGTDLTEKDIYNKIGKGTGDNIRIFNRGATFMRI